MKICTEDRLATETPTLLDCAHDFCRATHKLIKKQCELKFHYFTSKKRPHYQQHTAALMFEELSRIPYEKRVKMAVSNVRKLLKYVENFGKGVRQRSIRSDTTNENADSLLQYLYTKVACK